MQITLQASKQLQYFFVVLHLAAILGIWVALAPIVVQMIATAICVVSLVRVLRHHVWLSADQAVLGVTLNADSTWQVTRRNGVMERVHLLRDTVVCPLGIVLNFKGSRKRTSVLVCQDSVIREQFRRLCVVLKTSKPAAQ